MAAERTPAHDHLRERLVLVWVATVTLDAAASVAIYFLERDEPGTAIHSIGDALFWVSCQLLTVSSNLPNPISSVARVLDVFLELWAITAVGWIAGSFGAFFHRRSLERAPLGQASSD